MRRLLVWVAVGILALYLLLLIPLPEPPAPQGAARKQFVWNQDARWIALEQQYAQARHRGCGDLAAAIDSSLASGAASLAHISSGQFQSEDSAFGQVEGAVFDLGPMVAVCYARLSEYLRFAARVRTVVKEQSFHWDMNSITARRRMYRLLYGGRAAVEEVLLQSPGEVVPSLTLGDDEPSQTPSTKVLGVTIHSGDILASRGGAPTSALIARGNDYPGNFSHVALVHVDDKTNLASIIESHIERGVAVATLGDYLKDVKLRVMVLRLRADLPLLRANPLLPHIVALWALQTARARHIPYDFTMDFHDSTKMFCSEVVSNPYRHYGINLWMGLSSISAPGVVSWLSAFGVQHFETQEPSDLEYDPQLKVVAEWHDPETLFRDHVDNAVIDALLEGAENGEKLEYDWYFLPVGRLLKGYSILLNSFGKEGTVPEGMSAEAALRNLWFSSHHKAIKERTLRYAAEFKVREGYGPPYWQLLNLARRAKNELYPDSHESDR